MPISVCKGTGCCEHGEEKHKVNNLWNHVCLSSLLLRDAAWCTKSFVYLGWPEIDFRNKRYRPSLSYDFLNQSEEILFGGRLTFSTICIVHHCHMKFPRPLKGLSLTDS